MENETPMPGSRALQAEESGDWKRTRMRLPKPNISSTRVMTADDKDKAGERTVVASVWPWQQFG